MENVGRTVDGHLRIYIWSNLDVSAVKLGHCSFHWLDTLTKRERSRQRGGRERDRERREGGGGKLTHKWVNTTTAVCCGNRVEDVSIIQLELHVIIIPDGSPSLAAKTRSTGLEPALVLNEYQCPCVDVVIESHYSGRWMRNAYLTGCVRQIMPCKSTGSSVDLRTKTTAWKLKAK